MPEKKILVVCPGCGIKRSVYPTNLRRAGHSYCSGCSAIERFGKSYIGKTYGRLTILSDAEPVYSNKGKRRAFVNCLCSCGNQVVVERYDIFRGRIKSCGCLFLETSAAKINKLHEEYDNKLTESERERIRHSRKSKNYREWLREVKFIERCAICGSSHNLAAHHLESYRNNPELRLEPTNGVCLCAKCHVEYHTQFLGGYHIPATIATFDKFMRMKNGETDDE